MPSKSEKQANLFRAALGNPKPGTGAAKIKASMPREKIKHFTKVGESYDVCETCGGVGWYADVGRNGEPEQVQCQDCYGTGKKPSVGEGTMETLPEGSYNPRDDQFAAREEQVENALKENGLEVKMVYHMGAGEVGDPYESEFEVSNPKTGKKTTFTLREHYSLTLVLNGKKIRFPR